MSQQEQHQHQQKHTKELKTAFKEKHHSLSSVPERTDSKDEPNILISDFEQSTPKVDVFKMNRVPTVSRISSEEENFAKIFNHSTSLSSSKLLKQNSDSVDFSGKIDNQKSFDCSLLNSSDTNIIRTIQEQDESEEKISIPILYILCNQNSNQVKKKAESTAFEDIIAVSSNKDFVIGRDPNHEIFVNDPLISRSHMKIIYSKKYNTYNFYDFSKNGIWIRTFNKTLYEGTTFMIGDYQYQVDSISVQNKTQNLEMQITISHNDMENDEEDKELTIEFSNTSYESKLIGSDESCDIQIVDKHISPVHAKLEKFGNTLQIVDQNSRSGTWFKCRASKNDLKPYRVENDLEVKLAHVKIIKFKLLKSEVISRDSLYQLPKSDGSKSQKVYYHSCFYCNGKLDKYNCNQKDTNYKYPQALTLNPLCQLCCTELNHKTQNICYCFCKGIGFFLCESCEKGVRKSVVKLGLQIPSLVRATIYCVGDVVSKISNKKCPIEDCQDTISDFNFMQI